VLSSGRPTERLARYLEEIERLAITRGAVVNVGQITTADATDLATALALVNEQKALINQLLAALVDSGLMEAP
jgi:hypothetical protein